MKKKALLVPALSGLFFSTAILGSSVLAEETTSTATTNDAVLVGTPQASESTTTTATDSLASTPTPVASSATEAPASDAAPKEAVASSDSLTIIHTNDIHGRIEEAKNVIGMAKLATVVEESRAQGTTLVLDAGDAFQGMPISNSTKGADMATIMNKVGYDAMSVGNHEFDFSLDQAKKYQEILNFPILSANTYIDGVRLFQASTIIDKDTSVKGDEVVVIGVTTPETATKTHPNNIKGVTFGDPVAEVNAVISEVESKGRALGQVYGTYVVLAHLGVDVTTPVEWRGSTLAQALSENPMLAGKKVVVIDGHSHTVQQATYGNNVTYTQTGSYLGNIGKVTLNSQKVLAELIPASEASKVTANPEIAKLVADAKAKFEAENAVVVISNSPVELNGDRSNVRVQETNLGNAVADALFAYGQTGFSHPTNLAVTNGGGLRATIAKDKPVTKGDIISVLPFGNIISQIQVTGQQILDMFTKSLGSMTQKDANGNPVLDANGNPLLEASGGFLHVSGAIVGYDTRLAPADRVLLVEIYDPQTDLYKPLDVNKTYYLATNDFLASGGDGYTMLGGAREEGPSMDSVFAQYLAVADLNAYQEINPVSRLISVDKTADEDGDGFTDLEEYLAGTNDEDPEDYPGKITPEPLTPPTTKGESETIKVPLAVTATQKKLPATSSQEELVSLGLGVAMFALGLYGVRKKSER